MKRLTILIEPRSNSLSRPFGTVTGVGFLFPLLLGLGLLITVLPAFSQVSFKPATIIPLESGGNPEVGDFNGDYIPDIAAAYLNSSNISTFAISLGTGGGNFDTPTVYNPGLDCWSYPTAFDMADFNNDGYLDVVKTYGGSQGGCFGNKVTVHLGDGTGGFAIPGIEFTSGGSDHIVRTGEFNGDNNLDLVIGSMDASGFYLHFGAGNGSFSSGTLISSGYPYEILVQDLNNDGHNDLAVVVYSQDLLKLYFGDGNGSFSPSGSFSVTTCAAVTDGDFNEDDVVDLAVSSNTEGTISILLGTGGGSFADTVNHRVRGDTTAFNEGLMYGLEVGDFNGDGHLDLVAGHGSIATGNVSVLLGDGSGSFDLPIGFSSSAKGVIELTVADLDDDGWLDIAAYSEDPAGVAVLLNDPSPAAGGPPAAPTNLTTTPGDQQITLTWDANIEADLTKYRIYRDLSSPAITLIDSIISTSPPDTFYVDAGLIVGQDYYYRITAKDTAGNESDFSSEVMGTPITGLQQDSLALVALYNSTNGTGWANKDYWLTGPVSTWYGVTVSSDRVTEISLSYNNLIGTIPPEIGNLTGLTNLRLYNNQLTGSIPTEIGNLTNLTNLILGSNQLSGLIPTEIGNLINLTDLSLYKNQLSGSIPTEIGSLTNLDYLHLYDNQLSGSIPAEIGNLTFLSILSLKANNLSGSIPTEIGSLTNLIDLYLFDNQFTDLPDLSSITSLRFFEIEYNQFTFKDIEPNIGVASTTFTYSPQDSVGEIIDTTVYTGTSYLMSVSTGGTSSLYQWKKDGTNIGSISSDSTYTINPVAFSDSGTYTCKITNTVAAELTLYSRPYHVNVDALHVSNTGDDANPGTAEEPLRNIQTALSFADKGAWIKVAAGTYPEGLVSQKQVTLLGGYNNSFLESQRNIFSNKTIIQAVSSVMFTDNDSCTIDGFIFDGNGVAETGLDLRSPSVVTHNVIMDIRQGAGFTIDISSRVQFINNTLYNGIYGIYLVSGAENALVKNNILVNQSLALGNSAASGIATYNDFFSNSFNYFGTYDTPGVGDMALDPKFIDSENGDFRLQSTSPCIDTGDPDVKYNDPDGSRNDMGAYPYVPASSENDILTFSFAEQTGAATIDDINHTVAIEVAYESNVTTLVATFTLSAGVSATANSVAQESGVTVNDFTNPVTYTITAEDNTPQDWIVIISVALEPSDENEILEFSFSEQTGAANINNTDHTISIEVVYSTNLANLVATFSISSQASIAINSIDQVSGVTINNFTNPVTYTVTAENGTPQDWIVTVSEAGISVISDFPYSEDFEGGNGGWRTGGANSSWQLGNPAGPTINSATSGSAAWVTNLTGDYNPDEVSYVTSPQFDLSSLNFPKIEFSIWWYSEGFYDGANFQYKRGTGVWKTLGTDEGDDSWYNSSYIYSIEKGFGFDLNNSAGWTGDDEWGYSDGWVTVSHALTGIDNTSVVTFRIAFASNSGYENDGVAFDNINIYDDPTGIDPVETGLSDIQIYPNPNEGKFRLVYNGERDIDLKLQLINLQGQVILSEQIEAGHRFSKEFELEYLSAGIYYFRLMNKEGVIVKKMVVR